MVTIYTTITNEDGTQMSSQSAYEHPVDAENALLSDVGDDLGYPLEPDEGAATINDAYGKGGHEVTNGWIIESIRYLRTLKPEPEGCNSTEEQRR